MTTEELKLLITGDSSGGQAAVKDFGDKLKESIEHPLDSAQALSTELGEHLTAALGTMAVAATAAAAVIVAVGTAIFELTEKAAAVGSEIERLSTKVGDSTENISRLKYAVDVAGGSLESLTNVAYMISVRLGDAGDAGEKARSAIERLGLDVNEFLDASPSERILLLSDALRTTSESGDIVRRALMDLGGRGVRDQIDVLMKDLRGLGEQGERMGAVWSETDAKAAEEFEMQVKALHEQWDLLSTNIGKTFIPTLLEFAKAINGLSEALHHIPDVLPSWMGDLLSKEFGFQDWQFATTMLGVANEMDRQRNSTNVFGGKTSVTGNRGDIDLPSENLFGGETTFSGNFIPPGLAAALAGKGGAGNLNLFGGETTITGRPFWEADPNAPYQDLSMKLQGIGHGPTGDSTPEGKQYLEQLRAELDATMALDSTTLQFADITIPNLTSHLSHNASAADEWLGVIEGGLGRLPTLIERGLTGGGGLIGAMKAFGSDIGGGLFTAGGPLNSLGNSLTKSAFGLGDTFGNLVGTALPGLGSVIGSTIGPLLQKLMSIGGPSKEEVQGRDVEKQFEQSMGGWQGIQKALTDVGVSADQANSMIQKLWASEKQGAGATQQSIAAINKLIKDHATDVAKGVDGILVAAKNVGANFPAAMQPMVDKLLSLPGLTDAEKKSLSDLVKSAEPDFKQLTATAAGYGLTLADLGPKFQQADISGRADKIVSDFGALTKAGADAGGVLHGMGKSVNDLVNDALKYGSTLPTALKPLVEQLAKTGQLTDESGKKFTDVSKLTFDDAKDPLAKGLSNLTSTIQNLIDLLSGKTPNSLSGAIDAVTSKIPKNPFADWQVPDVGFDDMAIPMASGWSGRVSRPTLFRAGEAGPEDVSFGGAHRSGGGRGGSEVHVHVHAIDAAGVSDFVNSADFQTALLNAAARNGRGFGTKFSRAIPSRAA